jgi:hypothetical protein
MGGPAFIDSSNWTDRAKAIFRKQTHGFPISRPNGSCRGGLNRTPSAVRRMVVSACGIIIVR